MKRVRRRIARLFLRVTGAQLVTALVLAMLAIAVVGIVMAWISARDEILGSVDDRLRRRTQFVQDRYDRIVVTLERGLVAAAKDPGVARLDPSGCTGLRAALGPAIAYVRAVATVDAHGGIVCADRAWPTILDTLGFLPTAIASADRRVLGRPTADEAGGVPVAGLALAIRDGATPRGAVVLALDLQVLSQLIAGVFADDGSHVVVFDGNGRVVAATEAGRLATSMPADFTAAVRDAGRGSFPRVVELDDEPMVVRQGGVAGTDWTVVAFLSEQVVVDTVVARVLPLVASSLLGLVAVGGAAAILVVALLRPLRRMAQGFATIDSASPTAMLRPIGFAELRDIARAANRAFTAIRSRDRELDRSRRIDRELRAAVEGSSEALMLWDADDRLILANEAARRMFQDRIEQLVPGAPFEEMLRARVREGRILAAIGREDAFIAERLAERRKRGMRMVERQLDDGRWVESYEDATHGGGIFNIVRDITAEKRAELALADSHRRIQSVFDALAEGVIVRDRKGVIVDANEAACRILGLPRERIVGVDFAKGGVPWKPVDASGAALQPSQTPPMRTLTGGGDVRGATIGIHRPTGERRWISSNTSLVHGPDGGTEYVISSFTDVTNERMATASSVEKSRIIAAASHDLRQPLHAQALLIRALERRITDPETAGILASLKGAASSMSSMLGALLDLSRLDAGVVVPELRPVALSPLLSRLVDEFGMQARTRGLSLRLVDTRLWVMTDATLLETMLRNLIGNALRYTRTGGVLVGCRRAAGRVSICVVDTGPGIAPEDRERVFREFERGRSAANGGEVGMGLGLAIVSRLAGVTRAVVGLHSTPGRGSCFTLTMAAANPDETAGAPAELAAPTRPLRLALVDDDVRIRDAMRRDLGDLGHAVDAFASATALFARDVAAFDGFVVDLDLGAEEDGLGVVARLRAVCRPGAGFVIVTGDMTPATLERLDRAGVPYLIKPASGSAVLGALSSSGATRAA